MINVSRNSRSELSFHLRREGSPSRDISIRPKILVLFDIDGTISTAGSFSPCISRATGEVLGLTITNEAQEQRVKSGIAFRNWIREFAQREGIEKDKIQSVTEKVLSCSIKYFAEKLEATPIKPLAGSVDLLKELSRDDKFVIGVVTNNIEEVAMLKLGSSGLLHFFKRDSLIKSSEDAREKNTLIVQLIEESEEKFGTKFDKGSVFYFGDQVSDIAAGKIAGIKTIGVSTGRSTLCELVDSGANLVLSNLSNTTTIVDFVERNASPKKCVKVRR